MTSEKSLADFVRYDAVLIPQPRFFSFSEELEHQLKSHGVCRALDPRKAQILRDELISFKGRSTARSRFLLASLNEKPLNRDLETTIHRCYNLSAVSYFQYKTGMKLDALESIGWILEAEEKILSKKKFNALFAHYCQTLLNLAAVSPDRRSLEGRLKFSSDYARSTEITDSFALPVYEKLIFRCLKDFEFTYENFLPGYSDLDDLSKLICLLIEPKGLGSLYEASRVVRCNSKLSRGPLARALNYRIRTSSLCNIIYAEV